MQDDALIEKMAKAIRKRQMERTGAGRAFDETCPPTDGELDNASAALAIARRAILEEAAKVADSIAERLEGEEVSQARQMRPDAAAETAARIRSVEEVADAIRSLANPEQHNG